MSHGQNYTLKITFYTLKFSTCKEYPAIMEIYRISKTEEVGKSHPEYTQGRLEFLFWF